MLSNSRLLSIYPDKLHTPICWQKLLQRFALLGFFRQCLQNLTTKLEGLLGEFVKRYFTLYCIIILEHKLMYVYNLLSNLFTNPLDIISLSHNNTYMGNCFTGLCTKCTCYNNNLLIAAQNSGTSGVAVNSFN